MVIPDLIKGGKVMYKKDLYTAETFLPLHFVLWYLKKHKVFYIEHKDELATLVSLMIQLEDDMEHEYLHKIVEDLVIFLSDSDVAYELGIESTPIAIRINTYGVYSIET